MLHDTGMFTIPHTTGTVLCCKCGIPMQPNAANICAKCLQSEVDITEGLEKQVTLIHCPKCNTYLQPPNNWIKADLESKELLSFCINRLKKLITVRLIHAHFIWTEPHSKRIKIKLRIQKEVLNGAVLEQSYIVEYTVHDQMCESCSRAEANPDQWVALVQLRQHVSHRRTFFYIEQVILKHDSAKYAVGIKQVERGIDFYFANRSHGLKFVDFLDKVAPVRRNHISKQLVSHDSKSNGYNYKYTISVEICPICREDLICLPPKVSLSLGNLGPLVICNKVSNNISLFDPFCLRQSFMDGDQYWRLSFKALLCCRQLVEYIVLDIEVVSSEVNVGGQRYVLADAQIARVSDFGKNDRIFNVRTHLGRVLSPGDYALGYDLYGANVNDVELEKYEGRVFPDVVLVKKSYEEKRRRTRGRRRAWKLKGLNMEIDNGGGGKDNEEKMNEEYEMFLRDLEENPDLRFNLSLYRNKEYQPSDLGSMTDGEDVPTVPLEELLADLDLSDEELEDDSMRE